ncbi:MAG TPA: type 1 glutamine amidotransferase [Steroidobacteraceae bacterium]|nr:type 1 glutamine amidotransferase [Steroidobacteraceae bacterium]
MTIKVGILQTGSPPKPLDEQFGSYSAMVQELLGPEHEFATFDVRNGELPARPESCAAYVITGSASGVYDGDSWIEPLKNFARDASGRSPMVGICFGHQLMAEAFGGRVIKSPKGWGIGLHRYDVQERAAWMDDAHSIAVPASHQDQIVKLPDDARVLGGSEFTQYGILDYPQRRAMSLQSHPEFSPEYAAALIELRRSSKYTDEQADRALQTLRQPNDRARVGTWLARFLRSNIRG